MSERRRNPTRSLISLNNFESPVRESRGRNQAQEEMSPEHGARRVDGELPPISRLLPRNWISAHAERMRAAALPVA